MASIAIVGLQSSTQVSSSRKDRYRSGKAMRSRVPRESLAACPPPWKRDAIALLAETDRRRIVALLPLRYWRMSESPFGFLRGSAAVMAHDIACSPTVGITVQACGDCHVKNFGAFKSPEGQILFDINDFDDTFPKMDFSFDVKRLAASVAVLARDRNLSDKTARALAAAAARSYRTFMQVLGRSSPAEIWYTNLEVCREARQFPDGAIKDTILSILAKTDRKLGEDDNYPKFSLANGVATIDERKDRIAHLIDGIDRDHPVDPRGLFAKYPASLLPERRALLERYRLHDTAFKVVGIGSVGTYCAIGLFLSADDEPLYLQIKEARPSALAGVSGVSHGIAHRGQEIVEGQRALQAASDVFLGWTEDERTGQDFYVRQLKHRRLDDIFADVFEAVGEKFEGAAIEAFAELCGRALARAHARTGDPALLAGYMGKSDTFDEALATFAMAYADNTLYDHARLVASIDRETGVPSR